MLNFTANGQIYSGSGGSIPDDGTTNCFTINVPVLFQPWIDTKYDLDLALMAPDSAFIELASFVDYFILTELIKNAGGYRLSRFFYKDKDGKVMMGLTWDYDLARGNANYCETKRMMTAGCTSLKIIPPRTIFDIDTLYNYISEQAALLEEETNMPLLFPNPSKDLLQISFPSPAKDFDRGKDVQYK